MNNSWLTIEREGERVILKKCSKEAVGKVNIPDGEVYTAPVRDSINGYVQFNTDTTHGGTFFSNIRLEFKNGKIIKGTSVANNDKFQKILDICHIIYIHINHY